MLAAFPRLVLSLKRNVSGLGGGKLQAALEVTHRSPRGGWTAGCVPRLVHLPSKSFLVLLIHHAGCDPRLGEDAGE